MNTCYQCGQTMFTEEYYQQHMSQFRFPPKFNHHEHIIQNALFGRLKPNNILCKQCGNDYSVDIDKNFVSLFQMITETVKHVLIKKDHGKDSTNTLKGFLYDKKDLSKKQDVQIRDNIVTPKEPYYEYDEKEATVFIYANQIRAKQYQKVVNKELTGKGIDTELLTFRIIDDISEMGALGIFFSEGVEDFHQKFTGGICKIAVGFATYCGMERQNLPNALQIGADGMGKLLNQNNISPFFPVGAVDSQLEISRPEIERHYPSHTLVLFSQIFETGKKYLYCYIDLFSTFQYYVLLNEDFNGDDIYQHYHQALAKEERESMNVRTVRPKHLNIVASDYKVDTTKYKGSTIEEYYDFLQAEVDNYAFNPGLDLKQEVYRMLDFLMTSYTAAKSGLFDTPIVDNIKKMPKGQDEAFIFELHQYFDNEEEGIAFYRKNFLEDDGAGELETLSTPVECTHVLTTQEIRRVYCTMKFDQITQWIFENKPNEK